MSLNCKTLVKLVECKNGIIKELYHRPKCLRDRFYLIYLIVFGDGSYYIGKSNVGYQRIHFHCMTKMGKIKRNLIPKLASAFEKNDDFAIYILADKESKEEPNENDFLKAFKPPLNTILCLKSNQYGKGYGKAIEIYEKLNSNN